MDADDAHLTEVFRANVLSSFFCSSEAARLMSTQRGGQGGSIVNKIGPTVPLGRAGEASEVAQVIAFLAGSLSSYVHGTLIDVSGGR